MKALYTFTWDDFKSYDVSLSVHPLVDKVVRTTIFILYYI